MIIFFCIDTATTEIYTLSLHDALPIHRFGPLRNNVTGTAGPSSPRGAWNQRSEEHTSELQSHSDLVCRLLLEKKNKISCMLTYNVTSIAKCCRLQQRI